MEQKAIETLQAMLAARKMESTDVKSITAKDGIDERTSVFSIGSVLVIFSNKERGIMEKELRTYVTFAANNKYKSGLIVVLMVPPSDSIGKIIRSLSHERVQVFHIRELQFNITTSKFWMPHRILNEEERKAMFEKYKVFKPEEQLPWISSQDKAARWIGAIPGDVIEITRHSDVAGTNLYYRYCVEDENVS